MIARYVFVKLAEAFATDDHRAELVAGARDVLAGVAGVREVTVGSPADDKARVWDLSVALRFDDRTAVAAYLADPRHRQWVDDVLRPRAEVIKAWNFEV